MDMSIRVCVYPEERSVSIVDENNNINTPETGKQNYSLGLAQEIADYLVEAGYNAEDDDMSLKAANWGFEVAEGGTIEDFAAAIGEAYGSDIAGMINTENAGSSVDDLFPGLADYSTAGIQTGESAANITGIQKIDDYNMRVVLTEVELCWRALTERNSRKSTAI